MGIFNGNIGSSTTGSHTFIILDPHFQNYGVGSLTKKGFNDFKETDFGKKVLTGRTTTDIFTALNLTGVNGKYTYYNNGPYVQSSITQQSLLDLIDYHESGYARTDNKNVNNDETIKNIKNSIEGFVWFPSSGSSNTNTYASGCALKLYFYAAGQHRNDRTVANNNAPMITAVPKLPTGRKFLASQSKEARMAQQDGFFGIGTYVDMDQNITEDIKDTVTGPIRLSWNDTLGQWDSSNQILARLLTDIPPANIVGFDLSSNDLDNTNSKKFYDISGEKYMGQRSVGVAIPLSVQNNNPDMFGPNLIKCSNENNVEKIKVINRSNESFKVGDLVLCSFIGCEWIVQKFGTTEIKPQPSSVGRWGFYKFMANSDEFFRSAVSGYKAILPDQCQKYLRYQFYSTLNNVTSSLPTDMVSKSDVVSINLNNPAPGSFSEYGLFSYIQTSSFDLTDQLYGGTCSSGNSYKKINVEKGSTASDPATYRLFPMYWGPVFPDGYSSSYLNTSNSGTARIMAASSGAPVNASSYFLSGGFDSNSISSGFFSIDEVPADIAINGKYSKTSFPLEDTSGVINTFNSSNCATDINYLLNSGVRAYFLVDSGIKDVYGFTPNNPLKLQFSPLCAELACSDDFNTLVVKDSFKLNGRNFYTASREALGRSATDPRSLHGRLVTRLPRNLDVQGSKWDWVYGVGQPRINLSYGVPYDSFITKPPLNRPLAAPFIFNDDVNQNVGANLVGIIAARNSFQKNKGGNLNISAKQLFGLYGRFIGNGGGGSIDVTILGSIGSWVTNNTSSFKARYSAIWGSTIGDSINSFGTTALHSMVWDYWPERYTVFIPQYFSVAHFNSGILFSAPATQSGVAPENNTITKYVDKIEYSDLDFRVPSYARASGVAGNHGVVLENAIIESGTLFAPDNEWRVNTIRRGQMVTQEGFYYQKRVVGLNISSLSVHNGGSGFSIGDTIDINNDLSIKVTSVNGSAIQGIEFPTDTTFQGKIPARFLHQKAGSGFKPSDFKSPYSLQVKSPTGGQPATLRFTSGRAYSKIMHDQGPKQRSPITRLSSSSGEGTSRLEGTKNTTLSIEDNTGFKYAGQYEAFYFFHNDITHTFNNADSIEANPDFAQHITITIS
jgi:hypothetical protein